MQKQYYLIGVVGILALVFMFVGCEDSQNNPVGSLSLDNAGLMSLADGSSVCEPVEVPLVYGKKEKGTPIGVVKVWNDATKLYVQFVTDWTITETHVYVGSEPPKTFAPGSFPYKGTSDIYEIPLADLGECDDVVYIAAHAVVYDSGGASETAWGSDKRAYFTYTICCGEPPCPTPTPTSTPPCSTPTPDPCT